MFELFIALFGGAYIAGRCAYEKQQHREAELEREMWRERKRNIEARYEASSELVRSTTEFIRCGKHFDDICNTLCDDLRYVFGADWKDKLQLPKGYALKQLLMLPDRHEYWIYHLLLAKQGKIDVCVTNSGYLVGSTPNKDMCIRFAECIEGRLLNAGVKDIRLALELDYICGDLRRTPQKPCGGKIKIESLCFYPTHRLWADYKQK